LCEAGDALFQTHENLEHLAMMEQVLGHIPKPLAKEAARSAAKYFNSKCALALHPLVSQQKDVAVLLGPSFMSM
jgi:hypothetical protein